jgi:hypothetical protein
MSYVILSDENVILSEAKEPKRRHASFASLRMTTPRQALPIFLDALFPYQSASRFSAPPPPRSPCCP